MSSKKFHKSSKTRSERRAEHKDPESPDGGSSWSGAQGGNVLDWLAKKTTAQSPTESNTKGAIDFLNAQKKGGGMVPKPRSQQPSQTPASPTGNSGTDLLAMLAKKVPSAVQKFETEPKQQQEEKKQPVKEQPPTSTQHQSPAAHAAPSQRTRVEGKRVNNRSAAHKTVQPTQVAPVKAEMEQAMLNNLQRQQQAIVQENPEYAKWVDQQLNLQRAHETTRMDVLGKLQHQEKLSMDRIEQERIDIGQILDLVDRHDVTFICTDTGSGKSTSVPKALLELNAGTKIVSTQPRRTATVNIANRVASLRQERVGEDVGYWIRGEKQGDERTRLWYMTSYTLLLHLLNNPLHPDYTHIILDEFHERQPDLEVTVALLKMCLKKKTANFKLILMSATLNTDDWEEYFDGLSVAVYKQSEPDHPIHDYFMEDISSLVGMPYQPPTTFIPTMVDHLVLENHMFVAQHLIMFLNMVSNPQHSILVFLPGRANVEHFQMWAEMNLKDRVDIIPWHSAVDLQTIEGAIHRKTTKQKLYLATDIAEVSITLPDVVFVVDLALVKRPFIQPAVPATVKFPPLMTQWISKGSVAQRRGRVGRVQQGFYFCLVSKTLVSELPDYNTPPIQHSRIDELTLHALQLVAHPVAIFSICKGQPLIDSIASSMASLTHLGCIVPKSDPLAAGESISEVYTNSAWSPMIMEEAKSLLEADGGEMEEYVTTFIGRLLQLIPVSSQQGMLIFYGFLTGLESLMILAAAVSNCLSPFSMSVSDVESARNANRGKGGRGRGRIQYDSVAKAMESCESSMKNYNQGLRSDLVAVIGAVLQYRIKMIELDDVNLARWCKENQLSVEKLTAIVDLDAHIKYELSGFVPFRDIEDPYALANQLDKCAPIVATIHCAAFASQSCEVTTLQGSREAAVGLFTDLKAMPDLHSPSCFRWEQTDIVVPINISLRHSNLLVGFGTAMKSHKQFYLSLLLFAHRIQYATFCDDAGMYMQFRVTYNGNSKDIETDSQTGNFVVEFRKRCSRVCSTLRLRYSHEDLCEEDFDMKIGNEFNMPPMVTQQRDVMAQLGYLFQPMQMETMDVALVDGTDEQLDQESLLSFALAK